MTTEQAKQDIFKLVESETGYPVHVEADTSLRTISSVSAAGGVLPAHLIRYNPSRSRAVDYAICSQCGFIRRIFALPPPDRFDLASGYRGLKDVEKLVAEHLKGIGSGIRKEMREQLRDQMLGGLGVQLRSLPVGLRIGEWLTTDYPCLADQQRESVQGELNENMGILKPEIKRLAPEKILNANVSMNAAFAAYWSRKWSDPLLTVPFKVSGHLASGEQLLSIWDELPKEPTADKQLIQAWGNALGIMDWFELVPRRS